jgi:single-strand DNA-binding protein
MRTPISFGGNLTNDPELRFTPSGDAVVSFTVAINDRIKGPDGTWTDGPGMFLRCSLWRQYAENAAESLSKGTRVVVIGTLKQREYTTRDGEKRTSIEVDVEEVGPALRYATAKVAKVTRTAPSAGQQPEADPWATSPAQAELAPF